MIPLVQQGFFTETLNNKNNLRRPHGDIQVREAENAVLMDEPPPLEDCSEFLKRFHSHNKFGDSASHRCNGASGIKPKKRDKTSLVDIGEDRSCVASIISPPNQEISKQSSHSNPLRRGFLCPANKKSSVPKEKVVPFIKAKQTGSKVPDFLHINMEDDPQVKFKREMKGLLKPTEALVDEVMKHNDVKAGLEDPEVMSAVQDIASNPDNIEKYRHNPKVGAFYSRMGRVLGKHIKKQLG